MKKRFLQLKNRWWGLPEYFLVLLLLLILTGCGGNEKPVSSSFAIENQTIQESAESLEIDLNIPILSGFDSAGAINDEIAAGIAAARAEVEDAAALMGADQSHLKAGLHSGYLYSKNGDLVSLWMMVDNYTGGAHGMYWIEPYTFRVTDSERYDFIGLFREGNASAAFVTDQILNRIRENPELYFESAEETVKNYENQYSFYINGNQLVVMFSLYDIAPYAAGIQFFDFDAEELKDILKPEIYEAMKNAEQVDTTGTISEH